jgi:hypothetical protein
MFSYNRNKKVPIGERFVVRKYQLYLIEDEFAAHYFGRERMFFQLFQEHEVSNGELKHITKRQIHYITKHLQTLKIHQLIQKQLGMLKGFKSEHGTYTIELSGKLSTAKLEVQENRVLVEAMGNYDAETVFFEVLRKCETSFLAIDMEHQRFGWLKPIKERKFV